MPRQQPGSSFPKATRNITHGHEESLDKIHRLSIYETQSNFYIVGVNINKTAFRLIKVDRSEPTTLSVHADPITYTENEVHEMLLCLNHGNMHKGSKDRFGLHQTQSGWALAGFVRFTEGYYMIVVTKRMRVAMINSHAIYRVEEAELIPLEHLNTRKSSVREQRYVKLFQSVDFKDNFYFSYSYQQQTVTQVRLESTFLRELQNQIDSRWIVLLTHGFISQVNLNIFGRPIFVTLICRRSNRFAGTRFLKRGSDESGHVANEIETEQIVADESSHLAARVTSFVQLRGSVPGAWSQDSSTMVPKPPIVVNRHDPFADYAAAHFNNVFERYGAPIVCLNLVKKIESRRHESILIDELKGAISYLNQFLEPRERVHYIGFDMARASKKGQALVALERIARKYIMRVGFFQSFDDAKLAPFRRMDSWYHCMQNVDRGNKIHSAEGSGSSACVQQTGILRTNCVDCIDRTNTAQFVIGKIALGLQLYALGVIDTPNVEYDCVASTVLEDLFEEAGNTIARQYGGSQMVHRLQSYRRQAWADHWKDSLQTFSRYYSNTFGDHEKQAAINLFLGIYQPVSSIVTDAESSSNNAGDAVIDLWDLVSDSYLHNSALRAPLTVLAEALVPDSRNASQPAEAAQEALERVAEDDETEEKTTAAADDGSAEAAQTANCESAIDDDSSIDEFHRPWEFSWLRHHYYSQMPHTTRDYARALRECDWSVFAVPERFRAVAVAASFSVTSATNTAAVGPHDHHHDFVMVDAADGTEKDADLSSEFCDIEQSRLKQSFLSSRYSDFNNSTDYPSPTSSTDADDATCSSSSESGYEHEYECDGEVHDGGGGSSEGDGASIVTSSTAAPTDNKQQQMDDDDEAVTATSLKVQRLQLRSAAAFVSENAVASVESGVELHGRISKRSKAVVTGRSTISPLIINEDEFSSYPSEQRSITLIDRPITYDYMPKISEQNMLLYRKYAALHADEQKQQQQHAQKTDDEKLTCRTLRSYFEHMQKRWQIVAAARATDAENKRHFVQQQQMRRQSHQQQQEKPVVEHQQRVRGYLPSLPDITSTVTRPFSSQHRNSELLTGSRSRFYYRNGKLTLLPASAVISEEQQHNEENRRTSSSTNSFVDSLADERQLLHSLSQAAKQTANFLSSFAQNIVPLCDYSEYGSSREVILKPISEKSMEIYRQATAITDQQCKIVS